MKIRNSSFELLRIIGMVLIVTYHYTIHAGWVITDATPPLNVFITQIMSLGGKVGVNLFVLITGYFTVNAKFSLRKGFRIAGLTLFYGILILLIFRAATGLPHTNADVFEYFFSVRHPQYWFATTYIMLYAVTPLLNFIMKKLHRKVHIAVILVLLFLWSVLPTVGNIAPAFIDFSWFVMLYITAAYVKLRGITNKTSNSIIVWTCILYAGVFIFMLTADIMRKYALAQYVADIFTPENKIPAFMVSMTMFLIFKNMEIKRNKYINTLASLTFGIYLIHDNTLVRHFLWSGFFRNRFYADSPFLWAHALTSVTFVFGACAVCEFLRKRISVKINTYHVR